MILIRTCAPLVSVLFLSTIPSGQQVLAQEKSKLEIGEAQITPFEGGTLLREWEVRATGVKVLTVRLLVAIDGKSTVAQENVYRWDQPFPDTKLHLVYLHQNGQPFGAKDKRLPSFALRSGRSELKPSIGKREKIFLEGKFGNKLGQDGAAKGTVNQGKQQIVSWEFYGDAQPVINTVDGLVAATKGGHMAAILVLEWK